MVDILNWNKIVLFSKTESRIIFIVIHMFGLGGSCVCDASQAMPSK
jgi:hypothetical protein